MNLAERKCRRLLLHMMFVVAMSLSTVGPISCSQNANASPDRLKEYKTKTGKTIIISETHPFGQSLSTIEIRTKGFEYDDVQTYEAKGSHFRGIF
jgi:hypothetical protein